MVTKCFYDQKEYPSYKKLKNYRKRLLRNNKTIKITEFGAESRVFSSEERKISTMAKKVGMNPKRSKLLNRLIRYLKIKNALELGTSLGISTAAMAMGNTIKIRSLEGCPQTANIAQENFDAFHLNNIEVKVGEFDNSIQILANEQRAVSSKQQSDISNKQPATDNQQPIDLVFFDGNHQKEATLSYFQKLLPLAHNDSVFIFDDIHWSKAMEEAWSEITAHPKVKVSIDTFRWGFVFFRREQEKQHFLIRL